MKGLKRALLLLSLALACAVANSNNTLGTVEEVEPREIVVRQGCGAPQGVCQIQQTTPVSGSGG
jgi:hypothetical protein